MDTQLLFSEIKGVDRVAEVVAGGRQLVCRCKFCGDSKKQHSHHFYIKLEPPFLFYCQICRATGFMNSEVLKYFSVYNTELLTTIDKELKNYSIRSSQLKTSRTSNTLPIIETSVPPFNGTDKSTRNLVYIENRLGIALTDNDILEKRIITDFKQFLIHNNISKFSVEKDFLKELNDYYVGFLSRDGCYITFRDTSVKSPQRYVTYNIFNQSSNLNSFYTISNKLDIMAKRINLVMAEGIISLHGGYEYCKTLGLDYSNTVFASPSGKNFNSIINFFQRLGLFDLDIYFLSDTDLNKRFYERLITSNSILSLSDSRINLLYNTLDDDFGVPLDKIKTNLVRLK